eukprot:COSAG06_NODE_8468_length_2163_cov_1.484981_1_plen_73_part_00
MEWPKFFIDADHAVACADPISPHTMLARRNIAMLRRGGSIIHVCGGAIEGDRSIAMFQPAWGNLQSSLGSRR